MTSKTKKTVAALGGRANGVKKPKVRMALQAVNGERFAGPSGG